MSAENSTTTTSGEKPAHLEPSKLGTKEYWDALYTREISNHASNPSDEGTVWFDDSDAENKIVQFLDEQEHDLFSGLFTRDDAAVLDLGCGNGSLLFALHDDGWEGRLTGVDYSEQSVELARMVLRTRVLGEGTTQEEEGEEQKEEGGETQEEEGESEVGIDFKVWDVLNGDFSTVQARPSSSTTTEEKGGDKNAGWDMVLDKGTFDAVSLSDSRDSRGRRICENYGARVMQLLRPSGFFLVTSCNWTEEELKMWFETDFAEVYEGTEKKKLGLRQVGRIEYPSFSFGGVKGQTISTLCFQKTAI
ncbi:S-adenosyl-L-methionine-dependent methyltransferase [Sordaria brevicollis]|uniref:Protein-lysine N-methyltransferase EFM4 n=1 Tax=Sordaria brevicollis TaxID=83679 RepID=A0AAE0UCN6_SORBR|nr:S-adenosyl-L-methionine-dependent methyltransferase [Sordaria brevicollis]